MTATEDPRIERAKTAYVKAREGLKKTAPEFIPGFPKLEGSLPPGERPQEEGTATTGTVIEKSQPNKRETISKPVIERPRLKGFGYLYKRGGIWWIRYSHLGKDFRESSGSEKETVALRLLKQRTKQMGKGRRFIGPSEERVTMDSLFDALKLDYQNNQRRSITTLKGRLRHLRAAFGNDRAIDVTAERIERYKTTRLQETTERGGRPVQRATVNRELAALRKAFRLAVELDRLAEAPVIKLLEERNIRQGFVEPKDFDAIVDQLPEYLRDFARFAYVTGWRKGELQTLTWADVNREARTILLRSEHSKNEDTRLISISGDLPEIIERRWQARVFGNSDGSTGLAEFVFHCGNGQPIRDFRYSWNSACKKAGMPGLLFHDLRRSAIRNFDNAGVTQPVGMLISGHKTADIYRRYRITALGDIQRALERTQAATAQNTERRVIPIQDAKESSR